MLDGIKYLETHGFIDDNPTAKSIELRNLAAEYTHEIVRKGSKAVAICLTGSSVGGYSGIGSDIDLDVLIDGRTQPIKKLMYKSIPIDLQVKSYADWRADCVNGGESVRFLTHTVPIFDKTGEFFPFQKGILTKHYSDENMKRAFAGAKEIVEGRGYIGVIEAELGQLIPSSIRLESVLFEAISFLIFKYRGYMATSLLLSELHRIGTGLDHIEWFEKAVEYMRFDITKEESYRLLNSYNELFKVMREKLSCNMNIVRQIKSMKLGLFGAGAQLTELCSQINYQQLHDKIARAALLNKPYDAGLSLWFESHYNFFMFAPFFFLKNINGKASGKTVSDTPFSTLFKCWDDDVKSLWLEVYRAHGLTQESLVSMNNLANEILSYCE